MHRVLRKLANKHKLTNKKREKTAMYIEDLVGILQTNLTTIKKYGYGRHRIQLLRTGPKPSSTSATVTLSSPCSATP